MQEDLNWNAVDDDRVEGAKGVIMRLQCHESFWCR